MLGVWMLAGKAASARGHPHTLAQCVGSQLPDLPDVEPDVLPDVVPEP